MGTNTSLDQMVMLALMQPGAWLAFWAVAFLCFQSPGDKCVAKASPFRPDFQTALKSQTIVNVNQFKPTGLFNLKCGLPDTTKCFVCSFIVYKGTMILFMCEYRCIALLLYCTGTSLYSYVAQTMNGFMLKKILVSDLSLSNL